MTKVRNGINDEREIAMERSIENIKSLCDGLFGDIEAHYAACVDLCGEDDEANTKPAKEMREKAKALKVCIDCFMDGIDAGMQFAREDSSGKKGKWLV